MEYGFMDNLAEIEASLQNSQNIDEIRWAAYNIESAIVHTNNILTDAHLAQSHARPELSDSAILPFTGFIKLPAWLCIALAVILPVGVYVFAFVFAF